jgi:glycosyltransferase involved in cell wall biosynthesis
MKSAPRISIVIPTHEIPEKTFFLDRSIGMIEKQTFKDFEIILNQNGQGLSKNTNEGIRRAKGELVKILFMDDFLAHEDSLKDISDNFSSHDHWLVTAYTHTRDNKTFFNDRVPYYRERITTGRNSIGPPSVLTMRRSDKVFFDENLSWVVDCDFYKRYHDQYGEPKIVNSINVIIGIGDHQLTSTIKDRIKAEEYALLKNRYKKTSIMRRIFRVYSTWLRRLQS